LDDAHREHALQADDLTPSPLYRTFMIRCWLEESEAPAWRFAVLEVGSQGPRRGFARLEDVVAFLVCEMAAVEAARRDGTDRLVEVFQRAASDMAYRQAFMADPRRVLAEVGLQVPEEVNYQVVENTADCVHIVLPPLLSEEGLGGEVPEARATRSVLLCAPGPNSAGMIALIPGCALAS
jgi:hypothetical protein